jgi:acyl-CoA thioester hydrolase
MRSKGVLQTEIERVESLFDVDMLEVGWHGHYVKHVEQRAASLLDKLDHNCMQRRGAG